MLRELPAALSKADADNEKQMRKHKIKDRIRSSLVRVLACLGIGALTASMCGCTAGGGEFKSTFKEIGQQELNIPDDNYRTYYEVFVYSFCDSDSNGVGDLKGLTDRLDYIADMGFNGIWLMPIFPSPTYHKYDTTDYMAVDEQYGTIEDFDAMIEKAHSLGINVIIDLAINHTSSQHKWFTEATKYLRSLKDGEEPDYSVCPYAEYYHFSRESGGKGWYRVSGVEWFYEGSFWDQMPDLDLSCEALWKELEETCDFWISHGIDGFRMDAPLHYEENRDEFNESVLNRLYEYCVSKKPDFYMVSEVWSGEATIADYYKSSTPSMFNFDIAQAEGKLIRAGNGKYSAEKLVEEMVRYQEDFGDNNPEYIDAPFLTNHDMPRVANALNNNEEALKRAAGLLLTSSGSPFVYYGEEIGMCSKGTKDENKRLPLVWSSGKETEGTTRKPSGADMGIESAFPGVMEQMKDDSSLLNYYRRAVRLRNENPELARGYITVADELTEKDIAVIYKAWNDGVIAVVYNTGDENAVVDLSGAAATCANQNGGTSDTVLADASAMSLYGFITVDSKDKVTLKDGRLIMPGGAIAILRQSEN